MVFNPREVATLTVNGQIYENWKSVTVYLCNREAFNYYRFTTTERQTAPPKAINDIQIRPGHECTVNLGGEYAIGGYVTVRQVAYTDKSHGVEITGKTYTYASVSGAAVVKDGEIRDKGLVQAIQQIMSPLGIGVEGKGGISGEPFDRVNVTGQTAWESAEKLTRSRNAIIGTNPYVGNSYWVSSPSYSEGFDMVEEGVNILEGREIISMEFGSGPYMNLAQAAPKPEKYGFPVTSLPFASLSSGFGKSIGGGVPYIPLINMVEMPGVTGDAQQRSGAEGNAIGGEQIKVEVVVQGWFTSGGKLWRPYQKVHVRSPMLIMDQALICKSATFTQDDKSGTRTTLELWNENAEIGANLG